MKACFMGLGYIGLPTAIIAAKHGVEVVGVDINPKVVEKTNRGELHIVEPGLQQILQEVVKAGRLNSGPTNTAPQSPMSLLAISEKNPRMTLAYR